MISLYQSKSYPKKLCLLSITSSFGIVDVVNLQNFEKLYNFKICLVSLDPLIAKRSLEFELNKKLKCQASQKVQVQDI
jgi:hypothetical protein